MRCTFFRFQQRVKKTCYLIFFFQAEDGIRDAQESRGLGDVYKRQALDNAVLNETESYNVIYLMPGNHGGIGLTSKTWDLSLIHI